MGRLVFENNICKCEYFDTIVDERVEIKLIKPFNKLQIEERNCVMIALYECGLFINNELNNDTFATSFDYNSDVVTLNCFLKD